MTRLFEIKETDGTRTIDLAKIVEIKRVDKCQNVTICFIDGQNLRYDKCQCYDNLMAAWQAWAYENSAPVTPRLISPNITVRLTKGAVKELEEAWKK